MKEDISEPASFNDFIKASNWIGSVGSQHFFWIKIIVLTEPIQRQVLFFWCCNCAGFTSMFMVITPLHHPASTHLQTPWHYPGEDSGTLGNSFSPQGGTDSEKHAQIMTLPPPHFTAVMIVFTSFIILPLFLNDSASVTSSQNHFPSSIIDSHWGPFGKSLVMFFVLSFEGSFFCSVFLWSLFSDVRRLLVPVMSSGLYLVLLQASSLRILHSSLGNILPWSPLLNHPSL